MVEVYYYVLSDDVSNIVDCGLKLSAFHDKEVLIGEEKVLCFSGLLNPKDNLEYYREEMFTCLKVMVNKEKCYVADEFLYQTAKDQNLDMDIYYQSVIPIEKYTFGTYRQPECLITTTILSGEAAVLDKRMDSPVIYTNSQELYINNILQEFREKHAETDDCLLYFFLDKLAQLSKIKKYENIKNGSTVFKTESGRAICVKKPDLSKVNF